MIKKCTIFSSHQIKVFYSAADHAAVKIKTLSTGCILQGVTKGPHKEHDLEDVESALMPLVAKMKEKKTKALEELQHHHSNIQEAGQKEAAMVKGQITSAVREFDEILARYIT